MRVTLVPVGRGRWSPLVIDYAGPQVAPIEIVVGMVLDFAGLRWRVRSVVA